MKKKITITHPKSQQKEFIYLNTNDFTYKCLYNKLLEAKGINHLLNHCVSADFKVGIQTFTIEDDNSVTHFRKQSNEILITSINYNNYFIFLVFHTCRQKKVNMLAELNAKLRSERSVIYSMAINEQRKMRAIQSSQMTPFKFPSSCLIEQANTLNGLTQSLMAYESTIKNSKIEQQPERDNESSFSKVSSKSKGKSKQFDHKMKCSNCSNGIFGLRYKCSICDYNVCEKCKGKNNNSHEHDFFIEIENSNDFENEEKEKEKEGSKDDIIDTPETEKQLEMIELMHFIQIDKNLEDNYLIIPYTTKLEDEIDLEVTGNIEGIDFTVSSDVDHQFRIDFIPDNPDENKTFILEGQFVYKENQQAIDQKPFKIIVKIKRSES